MENREEGRAAMEFFAHSESSGIKETVAEHLVSVSKLTGKFCSYFNAEQEGRITGLLHDSGKFTELFQKRLFSKAKNVDHWSMGSSLALSLYKENGIAAAIAIQGHHTGLISMKQDNLRKLYNIDSMRKEHPLGLRIPDENSQLVLKRFKDTGLILEEDFNSKLNSNIKKHIAAMLDIRMLYSSLTDADFIATEAHFNRNESGVPQIRTEGNQLNPKDKYEKLMKYMDLIKSSSRAEKRVKQLRDDLFSECVKMSNNPPGIYTLSAPTGSGKTLAMLAFALRHAYANNLRRIIVVLPYLNIIEQTVLSYKNALKEYINDILEDHTLANNVTDKLNDINDYDDVIKLVENWDAPIIITTSVKFFESLFSNKPFACRKLHNIAKSIILFDEAQTLPKEVTIPTLAALSHLNSSYGCSIVFSTATQPAFNHLHKYVSKYSNDGWQPKELISSCLSLFNRRKKVDLYIEDFNYPLDNEILSYRISKYNQALCILNTKAQALSLYKFLDNGCEDGIYHMSTNMCTKHRQRVLKHVKERLKDGKRCILIATQCVEAGVDFDFPVVYRALAPLEAIAQAAGRCNREGKLERGEFHIFIPEHQSYPDRIYQQSAQISESMILEYGDKFDIDDPQIYEDYYKRVFIFSQINELNNELTEAIETYDFEKTALRYKIINNNTINVLVPYDEEEFILLCDELKETGINGGWIKKATGYSISLYMPQYDSKFWNYVERIKTRKGDDTNWFIYLFNNHYCDKTGLSIPEDTEVLIG